MKQSEYSSYLKRTEVNESYDSEALQKRSQMLKRQKPTNRSRRSKTAKVGHDYRDNDSEMNEDLDDIENQLEDKSRQKQIRKHLKNYTKSDYSKTILSTALVNSNEKNFDRDPSRVQRLWSANRKPTRHGMFTGIFNIAFILKF